MTTPSLLLRNVCPIGQKKADILIENSLIREVDFSSQTRLADIEIDGKGGALLPGLIDHHIHLFATAACAASVDLSDAHDLPSVITRIRAHADSLTDKKCWLRVIGYNETLATMPDASMLDQWLPNHPLRVQSRTGGLWILNTIGLKQLGSGYLPLCVERDAQGQYTGRIWRGDAWLRTQLPQSQPNLSLLGAELARYGVTGVCDAGVSNGPQEALLLAEARVSGQLPQKLHLMGMNNLPESPHYTIGALKLLFDESNLPKMEHLIYHIQQARLNRRPLAAHCVTEGELLFYLAALQASGGAQYGDRIEHGSLIPETLIADIAKAGLTIVTQPSFIPKRGDRYLAMIEPYELPNLYRLESIKAAHIPLAGSSDAPYGDTDPWRAIKAAQLRRTAKGVSLNPEEVLSPHDSLSLYLGSFDNPGGPARQIKVGAPADLCLLDCTLDEMLSAPDSAHVRATIIDGALAYHRD